MISKLQIAIPLPIFLIQNGELIDVGQSLYNKEVATENDLNCLEDGVLTWAAQVAETYINAFVAEDNYFLQEFNSATNTSFHMEGIGTTLKQRISDFKMLIHNKIAVLKATARIMQECTVCRVPLTEEVVVQKEYSLNEKLDLILNKLYHLHDGSFYPVRYLLVGNGVPLEPKEERGLANILHDRDLVVVFLSSDTLRAKLTPVGVKYVENQLQLSADS
jgi:hypothetical protein